MRTSLRVVGATCAAVLVLPACTSSSADPGDESETALPAVTASPSATDQPTASPSDTASPADPFAVPDPVTEEYVDRVVNTIYEEWGAITREILEQPADPSAITPIETRERIAALFGGQYLQQRLAEADDMLRGERDALLPPEQFDQLRIETRQIKVASDRCLVVAGDFVTTGTARDGGAQIAAFSLEADSKRATGWTIIDVALARDAAGDQLPDSVILDATVADLAGVLENSCS